MLEAIVTKQRDKRAALKVFWTLLRRHGRPDEIVTDRLQFCRATPRAANPERQAGSQARGRWPNNRIENSQLPF